MPSVLLLVVSIQVQSYCNMEREGEKVILYSRERDREWEEKSHLFVQSTGLDWISLIFISGLWGTASPEWGVGQKSHLFTWGIKVHIVCIWHLHGYPFDWHFPAMVSAGASTCSSWPWRKVVLEGGPIGWRWQCIAIQVDGAPPFSAALLSSHSRLMRGHLTCSTALVTYCQPL